MNLQKFWQTFKPGISTGSPEIKNFGFANRKTKKAPGNGSFFQMCLPSSKNHHL